LKIITGQEGVRSWRRRIGGLAVSLSWKSGPHVEKVWEIPGKGENGGRMAVVQVVA